MAAAEAGDAAAVALGKWLEERYVFDGASKAALNALAAWVGGAPASPNPLAPTPAPRQAAPLMFTE